MPRPQRAYSRLETDDEVLLRLGWTKSQARSEVGTDAGDTLDMALSARGLPQRKLVWVYP